MHEEAGATLRRGTGRRIYLSLTPDLAGLHHLCDPPLSPRDGFSIVHT